MPLSIYLDDCADDDLLVAFLQQAGHNVTTPRVAGTSGASDTNHLEYAAQHGHVLLTKNPDDFRNEHARWQAQGRTHSGILLVY